MARVVVRVEAYEVGGEDALEDLLAHWEHSVDLGGREGDVEEPTDLGGGEAVAQDACREKRAHR